MQENEDTGLVMNERAKMIFRKYKLCHLGCGSVWKKKAIEMSGSCMVHSSECANGRIKDGFGGKLCNVLNEWKLG